MMSMGAKAWAILAGAVVIYETFAPEEELLSAAVDRALINHPYLTVAAVSLTAMHLLNVMERMGPVGRLDPWVLAFGWRKLLIR